MGRESGMGKSIKLLKGSTSMGSNMESGRSVVTCRLNICNCNLNRILCHCE